MSVVCHLKTNLAKILKFDKAKLKICLFPKASLLLLHLPANFLKCIVQLAVATPTNLCIHTFLCTVWHRPKVLQLQFPSAMVFLGCSWNKCITASFSLGVTILLPCVISRSASHNHLPAAGNISYKSPLMFGMFNFEMLVGSSSG